jgi:GTP-binding protein EngB required for normal cell division
MTHTVRRLQDELDQIRRFVNEQPFFSLTDQDRESLKARALKLSGKLAAVAESFLTVGLLGGTGVGKSTLMNALAGSAIASTSHRRPHTDHVLIYRYAEGNPLPDLLLTDIPWQEVTHQSDAIRQILVCDLPDFDSLVDAHRRHVLRFMEYLDIVVWVTTPEKYGDLAFYEFLDQTPKAKRNFYFLLNKTDLLFEGKDLAIGYDQLARVTKDFGKHIREKGVGEPLIYSVSAQEAVDSQDLAPWNQFAAFRREIFQQRDFKEVTAIKAANLDVELEGLFSTLQGEVEGLETFSQILEACGKDLEEQRSSWVQAGRDAIDVWVEDEIGHDVLSNRIDTHPMVGPGYAITLVLGRWQRMFGQSNAGASHPAAVMPLDRIIAPFRTRLEWLQDRLSHRIRRANLSPSFEARAQEALDGTTTLADLAEACSTLVSLFLTKPALPSFRGFKARQLLTYLLLATFLLFAVGGESAWRDVFNDPGATNVVHLLVSCIHGIFSAKGLAALGSYGLLNLFFGFWFYRRYASLLRRITAKLAASLKAELQKCWEAKIDSVSAKLDRAGAETRAQVSAISGLRQEKEK